MGGLREVGGRGGRPSVQEGGGCLLPLALLLTALSPVGGMVAAVPLGILGFGYPWWGVALVGIEPAQVDRLDTRFAQPQIRRPRTGPLRPGRHRCTW